MRKLLLATVASAVALWTCGARADSIIPPLQIDGSNNVYARVGASKVTIGSLFNGAFLPPLNVQPPPPAWGTSYGNYFGSIVNVGGLPSASMGGGGGGATPSALVGAIDIPASDIGTFLDVGVAGYARSASTSSPAVGLFGGAMANADGGPATVVNGVTTLHSIVGWGLNEICTNANAMIASPIVGHDYVSCYGAELDVNAYPTSTGVAPHGTFRGLGVYGGSTIVPLGGAYGIEIGLFSNNGSNLPWSVPLQIDGQSSVYGILLGSHSATNAPGSPSQAIGFNSAPSASPSTGPVVTSTISADPNGNLVFSPYGGTNGTQNFLTDGNSNVILATSPYQVSSNKPFAVSAQSGQPFGISIGVASATNAPTTGSLALVFNSAPTSGGTVTSAISADPNGNLIFAPAKGANGTQNIFTDGNSNVILATSPAQIAMNKPLLLSNQNVGPTQTGTPAGSINIIINGVQHEINYY